MSETTNQPDARGLREILKPYHLTTSPGGFPQWADHEPFIADLIAWAERQCERQREACAKGIAQHACRTQVIDTPIVEIDP